MCVFGNRESVFREVLFVYTCLQQVQRPTSSIWWWRRWLPRRTRRRPAGWAFRGRRRRGSFSRRSLKLSQTCPPGKSCDSCQTGPPTGGGRRVYLLVVLGGRRRAHLSCVALIPDPEASPLSVSGHLDLEPIPLNPLKVTPIPFPLPLLFLPLLSCGELFKS